MFTKKLLIARERFEYNLKHLTSIHFYKGLDSQAFSRKLMYKSVLLCLELTSNVSFN